MKLIVTIDTEEDNWGRFKDTDYTIENLKLIPRLQKLFDDFGIKPSYLVTYPVATQERSVNILRKILEAGRCEIGAHCHPWNTPPFREERNDINSMLCNLSAELQYDKIRTLHNKIRENFGVDPVSFRAGRWGYNQTVARNLSRLGYRIDTSISSYTDWSTLHGPDFSKIPPKHYWFSVNNIFHENPKGELLEVPATVAYLQANFKLANAIYIIIRKLRLVRILHRLRLLNKVWLSPEKSGSSEMIRLTKLLRKKGYDLINFTFHSPSLQCGLTPFVKTQRDVEEFFTRIREYLMFTREDNIDSIKLSDSLNV